MLDRAARMQAAANALWRAVHALDHDAAQQRVAAWRRKYPKAAQAELQRRMVQSKSLQAGVVGAIAAIGKLVPAAGKLAGSVFGQMADANMATTLQAELV